MAALSTKLLDQAWAEYGLHLRWLKHSDDTMFLQVCITEKGVTYARRKYARVKSDLATVRSWWTDKGFSQMAIDGTDYRTTGAAYNALRKAFDWLKENESESESEPPVSTMADPSVVVEVGDG